MAGPPKNPNKNRHELSDVERNPTPADIGRWDGDWHELPNGTIWTDELGRKWRKYRWTRLKIGGSHPNAGAKPSAIRISARADLVDVMHVAKEIALGKSKSIRNADRLKAIDVLHKIGGLQSVALLNSEGEDAVLPPIELHTNVIPVPATTNDGKHTKEEEDDT